MTEHKNKHVILIVEDDEDDYFLITNSMQNSEFDCDVRWVKDGEEAMNYLLRQNEWQDPLKSPIPSLILLDINMPKKNGLEVLQEMKKNPALKNLFTVIFTSSKNKDNILSAYSLGANSYIQKPSQIEKFKTGIQMILEYWFRWVEYPYNTV
ncbi:MAG: response regulator [Nitrospina sp.]|nr:response regulator [Nitrospina sp.]MBT6718952.1 response regulator [Nitrospina sp.]